MYNFQAIMRTFEAPVELVRPKQPEKKYDMYIFSSVLVEYEEIENLRC